MSRIFLKGFLEIRIFLKEVLLVVREGLLQEKKSVACAGIMEILLHLKLLLPQKPAAA
jgi:hypothetical protein